MKNTGIIVSYNHENYIKKSIESLIQQTIILDQLIIVDDHSQDNTNEVISDFLSIYKGNIDIQYIKNKENFGTVKSVKKGLKAANGDLIYLQAGDDFSQETRVQISSKFLNENKNINMIYSSYGVVDEYDNLRYLRKRSQKIKNINKSIISTHFPPNYGICLRKFIGYEFINHVPDFLNNEDDTLAFIGTINGGIQIINDVLYYYRIHSSSMTAWINYENNKENFIYRIELQKKSEYQNLLVWKNIARNKNLKYILKKLEDKIQLIDIIQKREYKKIYKYTSVISIEDILYVAGGYNILYYFRKIRKIIKKIYYDVFFNN